MISTVTSCSTDSPGIHGYTATRSVASWAARFSAISREMMSRNGADQRSNSASSTELVPDRVTICGRSSSAGRSTARTPTEGASVDAGAAAAVVPGMGVSA